MGFSLTDHFLTPHALREDRTFLLQRGDDQIFFFKDFEYSSAFFYRFRSQPGPVYEATFVEEESFSYNALPLLFQISSSVIGCSPPFSAVFCRG